MNCRTFANCLDEYVEGSLAADTHAAAAAHLLGCGDCQRRLARAQALGAALRNLPVPAPRADFFERALARTQAPAVARRRWTYAGAALAASLALWIGFGLRPALRHEPAAAPAGVTIALHRTRIVQLAFNAKHALPQATLSITLPPGIELRGFPGQRRVRWQTNIARGANVLSLPLTAVGPVDGALLARLEHGDRSTQLTVPLHVQAGAHTSALPATCAPANGCKPNKEATDAKA